MSAVFQQIDAPTDELTDAQARAAADDLLADLARFLEANRSVLHTHPTVPGGLRDLPNFLRSLRSQHQQFCQLARDLHRRGTLIEIFRAKRAAALEAARARAQLTRQRLTAVRSRLPSVLSRARRHRPARRSAARTCRPSGRKKRHRSFDDPGGLGRRNGAGGVA